MKDIVDEFGDLTEQIRLLQQRRDELRLALLQPQARLRSNRFEVVIRSQTRRLLDASVLPRDIRDDPRYYKVSVSPIVTVRPLMCAEADDEDIVLIE